MHIASASKWVYASYVAAKFGGVLTSYDIKFLNLRSGYHSLDNSTCEGDPTQTVNACLAMGNNSAYTPVDEGIFWYDGGHFEIHAVNGGPAHISPPLHYILLGSDNAANLQTELESYLGHGIYSLEFTNPLLAGGIFTTPTDYAKFLREILDGTLKMHSLLGRYAVCTATNDSSDCVAGFTPVPEEEAWHYSLGHWVEDDPEIGDGAFSSGGARGFYPWIDAGKTWYGIVARDVEPPPGENNGIGFQSVRCGRSIRKAWLTGVEQTGS